MVLQQWIQTARLAWRQAGGPASPPDSAAKTERRCSRCTFSTCILEGFPADRGRCPTASRLPLSRVQSLQSRPSWTLCMFCVHFFCF